MGHWAVDFMMNKQIIMSKRMKKLILNFYFYKNKIISIESYANKCGKDGIYITQFKCANTSIKKAIIKKFGNKINIPENKLNKELDEKFIFTFVRNPYDKILSYYKDKVLSKSKSNNYLPLELEFLNKTKIKTTFKDFLNIIKLMDDEIIENHLKQMTYIIDSIKKPVWIGKVENIEKDWKYIMKKFNLPKLKKENSSKNYEIFYNEETANIVYERYIDDFKRFGYNKNSWRKY